MIATMARTSVLLLVTVATLSVSLVTAAAAQTDPVCRTVGACLKIAADARARVQGIPADDGGWFLWGLFGFVVLPQLVGLATMGITAWWANGSSLPRLIVTWRPAPTRQRGMTLVEVIVAMGIISIGLVALMAVIPYAATNVQTGSVLSTATFLANARIDDVKSVATPSLANPSAAPPIPAIVGYIGTYTVGTNTCTGIANDPITPLAGVNAATAMADYTRTTVVADVPDGGACPMKSVTVTTAYRGATKASVSIQISPR